MSNSGVNSGFAKCFVLFMALIVLVQGCVYLGLSIWGITMKECSKATTDITENPFQFAMDLIYFLNEDCGNPAITAPALNEPLTIYVNWGESDDVTNRTYIFMIVYAAISALWIVTSLLVITTICGPVTKIVRGLCFWPWFLVIIAGSILDAVATGFHIHDIVNTTNLSKTFDYLGLSAAPAAMEILKNFDAYFVTPSVILTCISSRIVLIWLLNIFGSSFCLSLSSALSKKNSSTKSSVTSANTTSTAPVTTPQERQPTREDQIIAEEIQRQQRAASPPPRESQLIKPKPLIIQNPTTTNVQRQPSLQQQMSRPYDLQSPSAPAPSPSPLVYSPSISEQVTYRNTESHPDRLNYPTQQQQQQPQQQLQLQQQLSKPKTPTYHEELSPISPLNSRYSVDSFSPQPQQNQRVSEELRGQLPWSYTSIPPPTPKKPQMQVYPEIPEPDYGH